ncbi:MAG: toprim domain-containing protein [Waltera sp.]
MIHFFESISNTSDWKKYIEKEKESALRVYTHMFLVTAIMLFYKIRLEGKRLLYGRLENGRFTYGLPRNTPRKSMKAVYGDLRAIKNAIQKNIPIFIPEGEKDVNTLTEQGYIAFTYGGCGDWQKDFAELVKVQSIFILADNDEPRVKVAKQIFEDLEGIANKRKIIVPMPNIPKADITDFLRVEKIRKTLNSY